MGNLTNIRFRAKVLNYDPETNPENGWVEGFYYQDLDNGQIKHYIFNCPNCWEIDPATLKWAKVPSDLPEYKNPITTLENIKELQKILVQTTIDYIKKNNLKDVYNVYFSVDGLCDAIEFGEWTAGMDSYISVEGLQDEDDFITCRKLIGEYM